MKRVLVTGATGFIGRQCLPMLLEKGYEVHGTFLHGQTPHAENVHWHQADLLDGNQLPDLVRRVAPTHLLLLAWNATPGVYVSSLDNVDWLRSSLQLVQLFKEFSGERVVGAGTCFEYDWSYGYCRESLTPLHPSTLYGTCKHALQLALAGFGKGAGLSSAWGRIFFLYGPNEYESRLVASVISAVLRSETAPCSSGKQIRDFLHVQDVAGAFVALLDSRVTGPVNIASGQPITIGEVVETIGEQLERPDLIARGVLPDRPNEPSVLFADVSRLTSEVGYRPRHDLHSGLRDTISWWRRQ
ncbi:MAG: NAD(P)-dependent oxidoreductase [Pirellulaceae bacterium]